jgi:hypothetical protein
MKRLLSLAMVILATTISLTASAQVPRAVLTELGSATW